MFSLIVFVFFIVSLSFLCSLSEAAILSVPHLRSRILVEQKRHGSRDLLYLKENMAMAVASLVIVSNCVNIVGSMFIGQQITLRYGNHWLGLISAILTFLIIFIGEVIPKAIGEHFKTPVALIVAKPVRLLLGILRPLVKASTLVVKFFGGRKSPRVTEEEIKMMLKIGRDAGTVEMDEAELCNRVFHLNDLRASQVMKPIRQAYMLPADKTLQELKDKIVTSPYSRIIVYEKNTSNIVGIVQHRILLREMSKDNLKSKIKAWMLKPIFVHHMMKTDALMEKFQSLHQHLFIVRDNAGKNIGLVSMEDVLEELFGEIYDEKDIRFKNLGKDLSS